MSETNNATCACQHVEYDPVANEDGSFTPRWRCHDCHSEFIPKIKVLALREYVVSRIYQADKFADELDWAKGEKADFTDVLQRMERLGLK